MEKLIYIVEDDTDIREMECYALKNSGMQTVGFPDSTELYSQCAQCIPDLILLDIMLPVEDGLTVLKRLRSSEITADIPVIMVTAKSTELDTVKGLDMGADDYITKPFGIMELVSRVKAILRRVKPVEDNSETLSFNELMLNNRKHSVTANSQPCPLTYKEYELLKYLMQNKNIVLSRDKIMNSVWGFDYEGESRTVDVHIKTLRQKLGDCGKYIKTIRNVGYKLGD